MAKPFPTRASEYDSPAVYEIRVRGNLGAEWSDWFDGLSLTPGDNGETILLGWIDDQPALMGVLEKLCALGLPMISVIRSTQ